MAQQPLRSRQGNLPADRLSGVIHHLPHGAHPRHASHIPSGRKDRKLWEDHLTYLHLLRPILDRHLASNIPLGVLDDFNQTLLQGWQPDPVFQALLETFASPLSIPTAELTGPDG